MNRLDFILALPEIVLLAGACALMIVDLFVKSEGRRASYALAQCVLLACAAATVFVLMGFRRCRTRRVRLPVTSPSTACSWPT